MARGLKKVLEDGTFPLKVREVQAFAALYKWAAELEQKIDSSLSHLEKLQKDVEKKSVVKKKRASQ